MEVIRDYLITLFINCLELGIEREVLENRFVGVLLNIFI